MIAANKACWSGTETCATPELQTVCSDVTTVSKRFCSLTRHLRLHALRKIVGREVEQVVCIFIQVVCIFASPEHLVIPATTLQVQKRETAKQMLRPDQNALLGLDRERVVDLVQLGLMR